MDPSARPLRRLAAALARFHRDLDRGLALMHSSGAPPPAAHRTPGSAAARVSRP
ncbi:hypothetical protein [Nocardiopsis suaedae]|uniref:MarR family transcriptional regulator n=1 Tax=Nocardiopsis suaedae TaxID=3018444 RepID=A0ABT4TQV8_9ACTN|nr:hypothetical protein [Nocardiopsis suaedae]MDA2806517.1 hypothetical protein [Nocardiopsis suaedae]